MLPLTLWVSKADIDPFDFLILDHLQNVSRLIGHYIVFLLWGVVCWLFRDA